MSNDPPDKDTGTNPDGAAKPKAQMAKAHVGGAGKFRKGISGNPNGRPKGAKNLATILRAAADANLMAVIDGKKRRITQLMANVWRLAQQGASGDYRAGIKFIELVAKMERDAAERRPVEFPFSPADLEVLQTIHERLMMCEAPGDEE